MGEIVGAQGIKGLVKLKIFGDNPDALTAHAPLCDAEQKKNFTVTKLIPHSNIWLAELDGIKDRTQAEKLHGTKLYLPRKHFPDIKKEGTYYHADLIGLPVVFW